MASGDATYRVGDVGAGATVLQGEYLYHVTLDVHTPEAAEAVLRGLRPPGRASYHGPLLRRLDPIVLVNRAAEIAAIAAFTQDPAASVLYVVGLPAIGKSTLVRGALELRGGGTEVVWVTCEGLDAEHLLAEVNAGLSLGADAVLADPGARLSTRFAAVLGALRAPCLLVLDGSEALLDADGGFRSPDLCEVMESLVEMEHRAKVLATTRRLPAGTGEGTAGVGILRLGGLAPDAARSLLRRAGLEERDAARIEGSGVLATLRGHPKFIELVASAAAELPVEEVVKSAASAADVGAFVREQVVSDLSPAELQALRAARVFRAAFPYDALSAAYEALGADAGGLLSAVRSLVRRAVLETVPGDDRAYFLHAVIGDAVPREPADEAAAHRGAAAWFLRGEIDPADLSTWDDGLHHLRRAARAAREREDVARYFAFLVEHSQRLSYAGWARRLVTECEALLPLLDAPLEVATTQAMLAGHLKTLGEPGPAADAYREALEALDGVRAEITDPGERDELETLAADLRMQHADVLLAHDPEGAPEEVARVIREIESNPRLNGDAEVRGRLTALGFVLARATGDGEAMARWAGEQLSLAEAAVAADPSPTAIDALAEAHFSMSLACLAEGGKIELMIHHVAQQLRLKLQIDKLTGVAAGLFNAGIMMFEFDRAAGGAMVLTSSQIDFEVGKKDEEWGEPELAEYAGPALADEESVARGREAVGKIAEKLLPYFERGLERWREILGGG